MEFWSYNDGDGPFLITQLMTSIVVTREQVKAKLDRGEPVQIMDVRSKNAYSMEHIRHARSIPCEDIVDRADEVLNRGRQVVVYGNDEKDILAERAAETLVKRGFADVCVLPDGLRGWRAAGYLTVSGEEMSVD